MPKATRDPWIIEALHAGTITTDPTAGLVLRDGIPTGRVDQRGYVMVYIGHYRTASAHRIIWLDAHGQPDDPTLQINHRNRIKHDNRLDNLEMVTASENVAHAFGTCYYNRIRPEDEAAVDPDWLERVRAIAARGNVTPEELAQLRGQDPTDEDDRPERLRFIYKSSMGRFSGCR